MCLFFLFFPFLSFPAVVYFCLWSDIEARGSAQLRCSAPDLSLAQLLLCCGLLSHVTFFLTVFLLRGLSLHPLFFLYSSLLRSAVRAPFNQNSVSMMRGHPIFLESFFLVSERNTSSFSLGISYPEIRFLIHH